MSDQPQGEGWWIASDGKWYPPESEPPTSSMAESSAAPGPPAPTPRDFPWVSWQVAVVAVLFLAAGFVAGLLLGRSGDDDSSEDIVTTEAFATTATDATTTTTEATTTTSTTSTTTPSTPSTDAIHLEGEGRGTFDLPTPITTAYDFTITFQGESNFIVHPIDGAGEEGIALVNEIDAGTWSGSEAAPDSPIVAIEVQIGDGPWIMDFVPTE